jgi:hypothetical protein
VMEVCQDKSDPNVSSPAVALEFFKGIGVPSSIEEKDLYDYYDLGYVVPATGKPVREVRVLNITKDGSKAYIAFYRTLEECQVVAKFWQDGKSLEDKELKKYR